MQLIRKGNQYYNAGEIDKAKKVFLAANYQDGIIRVADYYYEMRKPAAALLLYRHAGCHEKVEEIYERIVLVIRKLLAEDAAADQAAAHGVPATAARATPKTAASPIEPNRATTAIAQEFLRHSGESESTAPPVEPNRAPATAAEEFLRRSGARPATAATTDEQENNDQQP